MKTENPFKDKVEAILPSENGKLANMIRDN